MAETDFHLSLVAKKNELMICGPAIITKASGRVAATVTAGPLPEGTGSPAASHAQYVAECCAGAFRPWSGYNVPVRQIYEIFEGTAISGVQLR